MVTYVRSAALCLLATVTACSDPTDPGLPRVPRPPQRNFTAQETMLGDASIGFGLRLYQRVVAHDGRVNVMLSPLSASLALGMTMNGAQNATYDAMRSTLGFASMPEAEINASYRGLVEQLLARAPTVTMELANSIWHDRGLVVKQPFIDANHTYFDAEVNALDFAQPSAVDEINKWAERKTHGRITDILREISDEVMFLVNAMYFKAPWASKFDKANTRDGAFHRANGSTVTVPLMKQTGAFNVANTPGFTAVELPYADSAFSMVLLLPPEGVPLSTLEARLNTKLWDSAVSLLKPRSIQLLLPRFKFDYDSDLIPALTALGMEVAFGSGADFGRIANLNLMISKVYQKTFVETNESGSEAAAVTIVGVGIVCACPPPTIEFNRPFLFAIRERQTGALLFLGRVGDPSRN
jgi:serpin B